MVTSISIDSILQLTIRQLECFFPISDLEKETIKRVWGGNLST